MVAISYVERFSSALQDFSSVAQNFECVFLGFGSVEYTSFREWVNRLLRFPRRSDAHPLVESLKLEMVVQTNVLDRNRTD